MLERFNKGAQEGSFETGVRSMATLGNRVQGRRFVQRTVNVGSPRPAPQSPSTICRQLCFLKLAIRHRQDSRKQRKRRCSVRESDWHAMQRPCAPSAVYVTKGLKPTAEAKRKAGERTAQASDCNCNFKKTCVLFWSWISRNPGTYGSCSHPGPGMTSQLQLQGRFATRKLYPSNISGLLELRQRRSLLLRQHSSSFC